MSTTDPISLLIKEKDFRQCVVDYAKLRGYLVYFTWRSDHSPAGYPDLTLLKNGRLLFAELKTEKGKLSAHQENWLAKLQEVPGIEVFVWKPSNWAEITEELK